MKHPDDNKTIDMMDKTFSQLESGIKGMEVESRRGRKPLVAAEPVTDVAPTSILAEVTSAANAMSAADMVLLESSELYMAIGRIQFAHFVETVSARVIAESYLQAKEIFKKIKHLPVRGRDGKTETVSDLDQFCAVVLGKTARRCRQHAENLHLLGPELFEQAEAVGLRQRDYAAIKALPDDSRLAVAQAIESGDRSAVIDLVQELAARTEVEKKKRVDAEQTAEARARLLSEATEKNLRLQEKLRNPYVPDPDSVAQTQEQEAALKELQAAFALAHTNTMRVAAVCSDVFDRFDGTPLADHARACIDDIVRALAGMASTHGINVDLTLKEALTPAWLPR